MPATGWERLRSDYPRRQLSAPTAYSKQPFVDRPSLSCWSPNQVDVDGLRRGNLLDRHHTVHRGKRHEYEWVTAAAERQSRLAAHQLFRIIKDGEVKYRGTDLVPTTDNIVQRAPRGRVGRSRMKGSTP